MAEQNNPYAAPSAPVADAPLHFADGQLIDGGRAVPSGNGWDWIADGFDLFKRNPGIWIVNLIILFALLFVLALIPFLGGLASYVLMPIFSGGLMLGCQALMRGEPLEVGHLFAGFREKGGSLAMLGVYYLIGIIAIVALASVFVGFGAFTAMFAGGARPNVNLTMVMLMLLIVLGLSIPLAMAIWFAPALVVFHDLPPLVAMKESFSGCVKNIVPFLLYGLLAFVISVLATIPAGLGWLVWGPTVVASVYMAYRDIFVRAD